MSALRKDNPQYAAVKIIKVDWDQHSGAAIFKELNIPRRSTLVMFKGGVELGRVLSRTTAADIEPLFSATL